jgi:prevent-host-death family protein
VNPSPNGRILVTMKSHDKSIPAGKFKAECLALLDMVARTGQTLVITKRGRPVARVVPLGEAEAPSLAGSVRYHDDIVAPLDERWDAEH